LDSPDCVQIDVGILIQPMYFSLSLYQLINNISHYEKMHFSKARTFFPKAGAYILYLFLFF